jgi:Lon protease-like protein
MGKQPSTIDRLPDDVRIQLQELLRDPRVTQLEATARINAILEDEGHPDRLSKSAVNRYAVRMEEVGKKLRETREIAQMWIGKLGAEPQGEVGKLLNEMVRTLAFRAAMNAHESVDEDIDPKLLKSLAVSVYRLERAASENQMLEEKIRKQERETTKKEAVDTLSNIADADTIKEFRKRFL